MIAFSRRGDVRCRYPGDDPDETYSPNNYETPEPIVEAFGGNVLKNFRVEIHFPHGNTYLEQNAEEAGKDMNSAGLVLDMDTANHLVVRAVTATAAALTKENIHANDEVLEIEGKREKTWTIIDASNALAGAAGKQSSS